VDTTPTTAASAVTEGLVEMMPAKRPGVCAAGRECIRATKDRIGYSKETGLAFCWRCAENPERLEIVRAAIAARTGERVPAALVPSLLSRRPKSSRSRSCGQCQSCLAGGGPCDEIE
jgi:hypothetical protein